VVIFLVSDLYCSMYCLCRLYVLYIVGVYMCSVLTTGYNSFAVKSIILYQIIGHKVRGFAVYSNNAQ